MINRQVVYITLLSNQSQSPDVNSGLEKALTVSLPLKCCTILVEKIKVGAMNGALYPILDPSIISKTTKDKFYLLPHHIYACHLNF